MKMTIFQPQSLNEKGRRNNNQDSIYPKMHTATPNNRVFLVCDGVGGAADGEIASSLVADGLGKFFENHPANAATIDHAINQIQTHLDAYLADNPRSRGMGTTLTFLQLHDKGATVAHAGDSRVYQFRLGKVVFCTSDHSLINELRRQGKDTEGVGSNIITRAIQGHSVKSVEAETTLLSDVQADDYFLLCSDGVWGVFEDDDLAHLVCDTMDDAAKMALIAVRCAEHSMDNYSAYLVHIQSVEAESEESNEHIKPHFEEKFIPQQPRHAEIQVQAADKPQSWSWMIPLSVTLFGGAFLFWFWHTYVAEPSPTAATPVPVVPASVVEQDTVNLLSASPIGTQDSATNSETSAQYAAAAEIPTKPVNTHVTGKNAETQKPQHTPSTNAEKPKNPSVIKRDSIKKEEATPTQTVPMAEVKKDSTG